MDHGPRTTDHISIVPFFKSVVCCPLSVVLFLFLLIPSAHALPRKGFYEGPYLTLSAGLMQFDWDVNQRTQMQEANTFQTMLHLGLGWNLTDVFAPELNMRFATDRNGGRREYITGANLGLNFTLLIDPLLNFEKWKILPLIKPYFVTQVAILPGDPQSGIAHVASIGEGGGIGGGIRFLVGEYLYLGLEAEEDFILQRSVIQAIGGNDTLIYNGGWKKQFEALGMIGVHF